MDEVQRLPIKIVIPQDSDHSAPPSSRGPARVFGKDIVQMRNVLAGQIGEVRECFSQVLCQPDGPPAVARVALKREAFAKSHRPYDLFSPDTCPIIGGEGFGHMLVSVSAAGLDQLEEKVLRGSAKKLEANISTVEQITPYTAADAIGSIGLDGLAGQLAADKALALKLRLFQHADPEANAAVHEAFLSLLELMELPQPEAIFCISDLMLYRVTGITPETIGPLAQFVGVQSLGLFSQFGLVSQYAPRGEMTEATLPPPNPDQNYPIVGIIDSGTDPENALLQAWVEDRDEDDVPPADQDNNHGSFVAGLIANGRGLNHGDERFPSCQAKVVDVVGIPKSGTPVFETDMLQTILRAVQKYPDVKIWNLSFSNTGIVCRDDGFSTFAMELDAIQKRYGVTFVSCAGNYDVPPLRGWPPEVGLGEEDRISPPADSAMGVAVGSYAHRDRHDSRVRKEEPSPFSRRGPGAAFLPKPEVCHYGGNSNAQLDCQQIGVLSADGSGQVSEAIGTSFSTPLVTSVLGNLRHSVTGPVSPNLAKALLVHSAALRSGPIKAAEFPYRGFGVPGEIDEILTCAPWQATLIFEPKIDPEKRLFAREEFPIPKCFRCDDDRIEGEFLMTLVYDPPVDPAAGAEYCQTNIDVSLGTYDSDKEGKPKHSGEVKAEPKEMGQQYESYLVEHGFKWSPVKVFRKRFRSKTGENWRIFMRLFYRGGVIDRLPQNAALVVTMLDPKQEKPVYNDVVQAMNRSGWLHQDLQISAQSRLRAQH